MKITNRALLIFFFFCFVVMRIKGSHKKRIRRNKISEESVEKSFSNTSGEETQGNENKGAQEEEMNWVGKETRYPIYVGKYVPEQEDYATEDSETFSDPVDESSELGINFFPLIRNSGNSCAFDSLLQVLLMLEFSAFNKIKENERAYKRCLVRLIKGFPKSDARNIKELLSEIKKIVSKFEETDQQSIKLRRNLIDCHMKMFAAGYSAETQRMADPTEIAYFFFAMLGNGSALYEWSTQDKMLILSVNNVFDLGELLQTTLIAKAPQWQIYYLTRTYRKYQRSQRRTNFLSQRNIRIPMYLSLTYQSKFKAAICVDTKTVPHYFVITREKSTIDSRYYFVRYDGLAKSPEVLDEKGGIQLIERMSIMLFYQKVRLVSDFVYENNRD